MFDSGDGELGEVDEKRSCNCQTGTQIRHREIRQLANDCGHACEGQLDEVRNCTDSAMDFCTSAFAPVDCKFGEWTEWDDSECMTQEKFAELQADVEQ